MIIWTFFQISEDIYRYKKCYLPNALRPTSVSYLDLYCATPCFKKLNHNRSLPTQRQVHRNFLLRQGAAATLLNPCADCRCLSSKV